MLELLNELKHTLRLVLLDEQVQRSFTIELRMRRAKPDDDAFGRVDLAELFDDVVERAGRAQRPTAALSHTFV